MRGDAAIIDRRREIPSGLPIAVLVVLHKRDEERCLRANIHETTRQPRMLRYAA
jgi:hypothetical protein